MGICDFGYTGGGLLGSAIGVILVYYGLLAPICLLGMLVGVAICIVLDVMSIRGK